MKINKIRLKNINSLRGDWELDFTKEPFVSAMLFSITGPTGSGKSTLLDAVTLSLFNQIPRIDKALSKTIIEEGGFILSRNETECAAEVEYSCKSGTYRSKWSISVNRNGNLRDYEMEITDLSTNQILDKKKREIPDTNAELIGLNYDQFIRSILLSQGGFSRFLDARKEERAKLLEQITGTDIYRKLGIKAFEKWKEKNKVIETNEVVIENLKKELLNDEDRQNKNEALSVLSNKIKEFQEEKDKLTKLKVVKESIARLEEQVKENEIKLRGLKEEEILFSTINKSKLIKHRALAPYIVQIKKYNELVKAKEASQSMIPVLEEEKKQIEVRIKDLKNRIEDFVGMSFSEDDVESAIHNYRGEIVEKEKLKTSTKTDYSFQESKLREFLNKKPLDAYKWSKEHTNIEEEIKGVLTEVNKALSILDKKGFSEESISKIREESLQRKEALIQLKGSIGHYTTIINERKQINDDIHSYSSKLISETVITELETAFSLAQNKVEEQNEKLIRIREENSTNIIALRNSLRENEPCMVCGSVHHPYKHEYIAVLNEELDVLSNLKNQLNSTREQFENAKNSNTLNSNLLVKKKLELEEKEEELRRVGQNVDLLKKTACIEEVKSIGNLELFIKKEEETLSDVQLFTTNIMLLVALNEAKKELSEASKKKNIYNNAEEALLSRYKGENILKDTEAFLKEINTTRKLFSDTTGKIDHNEKELDKNKQEIIQIEKEILGSLKTLGYSSIMESDRDILDHAEFLKLDEEETNITTGIQRYQQLIDQNEKLLQAEQKDDDASMTKEQCNNRLEKLLPELTKTETEKSDLSYLVSSDIEKRNKINLLEEEIAATREVNKKWTFLNKLIGDATGNRFNSFAQKFTLAKLVKLANVHLKKLNERYILDMPGIGEEEDLIIVDGWMGEERRSVKTLSGGEKFLISLSLALALSDLASKHVKIESLFIDEGFGTLDPETLDQAISTLEQLQSSSGKSVGIISHVEELKERIQTQIKLEKSATGFSTISILPES